MKILLSVLARIWALPATLAGLVVVPLAWASGGRVRRREGTIEVSGGLVAWLLARIPVVRGAAAMTLGHVVLGRDEECLAWSRRHERVHVRQYELLGPLFLPAYLLASLVAVVRGGHYYRDNAFERAAFRVAPPAGRRPVDTDHEREV